MDIGGASTLGCFHSLIFSLVTENLGPDDPIQMKRKLLKYLNKTYIISYLALIKGRMRSKSGICVIYSPLIISLVTERLSCRKRSSLPDPL